MTRVLVLTEEEWHHYYASVEGIRAASVSCYGDELTIKSSLEVQHVRLSTIYGGVIDFYAQRIGNDTQ
jgi:hypothetical protein